MVKKVFLLFVLFSLPLGGVVYAQDAPKEDRLITKANESYNQYSFSPAIDIYKKVLEKGFVSADLLKKLGNSYYFNADYRQAAKTFKRLIRRYESEVGPEHYFRYTQTLKTLGQYDEAEEVMAKFIALTANDNRAEVYKGRESFLEQIKKNSGRYELDSFKHNTSFSEFAPSFYQDGLIFSSDRDTGNMAKYRHTWNSKDFLDLYAVNTNQVSRDNVIKLEEIINTRLHESTSTSTKDGQTIYFTRNNVVEGKAAKDEAGVTRLKIYKVELVKGIWSNIQELPFNSDSHSVAHPSLSYDEKTLYFASDMEGSLGESDIFMVAINDDGSYGEPVNLGSNINTEARETFPFVSSKDILYFSSDGHSGLGGLDIFSTKIKNKKFKSPVVNVGEPVNSNMDDFTFIINEDTRKGYFASNRAKGRGADDIYGFFETKPSLPNCQQKVSGIVRDKVTNEILVGVTIKVIDEENEVVLSTITDGEGAYAVVLDCSQGNFVRASIEGYITSEDYMGTSDGQSKKIDFFLERDTFTAGFGDDLAKLLQLSTIYFDYNKFDIRADSEVEVEKVIVAMEKYPSLKIRVNAHTDSRGKDAYNLWLSQKRAESTVNYMISKGIAANRLQKEGYGETRLVNDCTNNAKCTRDEHELNRRSEFIIFE